MELTIPSLTTNLIGLNALLCFLVIIVVWAYLFGRVKFSQALLGAFCCVVMMLIENLLDSFALADGSFILRNPALHTLYIAAFVVILRVAAQYGLIRTVLFKRFDGVEAALGFAIGFAAMELIVGGISNLTTYTLCVTCNNEGLSSILSQAASPEEAAALEEMLRELAASSSWDQLFSSVNRMFYLLQCVCVAVMIWYAVEKDDSKTLLLAALCHAVVRLPYGMYTAGLLLDFHIEEILTYVFSAGFGYVASRRYNELEGQKFRFKADRLSSRPHR